MLKPGPFVVVIATHSAHAENLSVTFLLCMFLVVMNVKQFHAVRNSVCELFE